MWETLRKEDVVQKLRTKQGVGLSQKEVILRKQKYGGNKLEEKKKETISLKTDLKDVEINSKLRSWVCQNFTEIINQPTKDVYLRYSVFCSQSQLNALSKIAFSKCINKRLGTNTVSRRINGAVIRIFVEE